MQAAARPRSLQRDTAESTQSICPFLQFSRMSIERALGLQACGVDQRRGVVTLSHGPAGSAPHTGYAICSVLDADLTRESGKLDVSEIGNENIPRTSRAISETFMLAGLWCFGELR